MCRSCVLDICCRALGCERDVGVVRIFIWGFELRGSWRVMGDVQGREPFTSGDAYVRLHCTLAKPLFLNITAFLGSLISRYNLGLLPFEYSYYLCIFLAALRGGFWS
jgi:hypothetical protein